MDDSGGRDSTYRDSATLALGSVVSGIAAYAFIAVGTRSIGSDEFAPVSVLWTIWAMSAAVFTFPVQHWVIRTAVADGGERRVGRALPSFAAAALVMGGLVGLVCWVLRSTLFGPDEWFFPFMASVIPLGSVVMGLNRGVLAARRRFRHTAFAIAGENLIRLGVALAVASATGLGVALTAGFAIALLWPSSFKLDAIGSQGRHVSPLAFVGGVAGGSLIGQIVLTSGPIALALIGGTPTQVTALFSALAVFRAPYMVAIGVSPRITAGLTRIALDHDSGAINRLTWRTLGAAGAMALVAAVFGGTLGPLLLTTVFGPEVVLPARTTAVVAIANALALCSLYLTLVLVAVEKAAIVTVVWVVAAMCGGAYLLGGAGSPVDTVATAVLVSEVVALGAMALVVLKTRSVGLSDHRG